MASPALLADLAKNAPDSPLAKRLFADREAPATSASTLTEVVAYKTAAKTDDSTPADDRHQGHHAPKEVIDRLDANEQRQDDMHEQLLQRGKLLNDLVASQVNLVTMIAQLNDTTARLTAGTPAPVGP